MKKFYILLTVFTLSFLGCSESEKQETNLLKLWYNKPAKVWEEALPLGNGRLGAMVFGTVATEHLQLNEETVWAGEPGNNLPKGFKEILPQVRKLIFEGKYKEAESLTMSRVPRHAPKWNNYGMPYQTVGDLYIEFPGQENVKNYYRELDIQNAISSTIYSVNGVSYKREYFISAPDQVMVVRVSASEKGKISCNLKADSPHTIFNIKTDGDQLILSGQGEDLDNKRGKVKFETIVKPVIVGGTIAADTSSLQIQNADSLTLFISIGTNFKNYKDISGNEAEIAKAYLNKAIAKSYESLKESHIKDYRTYFDRVSLDLGVTDSI